LPIATENITWANGFGANSYAEKYAHPKSPSYNPVEPTYKNSAGLHPGLDFGADAGTSVYSNVHGRIQIPSPYPGDAGTPSNIIILLDNGMYVVFGHTQGIDGLEHGQEVIPGDLIGTVGDKDANSHLHLALRQSLSEGERVYNPANYFSDPSVLDTVTWSGYSEGENLYSISSFLYQPVNNQFNNYWTDGGLAVGVIR
jgi:murein DD-endopeptidase MepM/ murein hydrolase activator NlpD